MNDLQTMPDDIVVAPDGEVPPVRIPAALQGRDLGVRHLMERAFELSSKLEPTDEEKSKLRTRFADEDVEILPSGEVYLPHILIRNRLSETFGEGSWAMIPVEEQRSDTTLYVLWVMIVRGHRAGQTWAGKEHFANARVDLGDDYEGTESVAVRRIAGKMLHCGDQVWIPSYCRGWIKRMAVQVWREKKPDQKVNKPQWRRIDAGKFWDESGFVKAKDATREPPPPEPKAEPPAVEPTTLDSLEAGLKSAAMRGLTALKAQWETLPRAAKEQLKPKMDAIKETAQHADFCREMGDSLTKPAAAASPPEAHPEKAAPPAPEQPAKYDEATPGPAPVDVLFGVITLDERNRLLSLLTPFGGFSKEWARRFGAITLDELPNWTFKPLQLFLEQMRDASEFDDMLEHLEVKSFVLLQPAGRKKFELVMADAAERKRGSSKRQKAGV